jgi:hypothetical protein
MNSSGRIFGGALIGIALLWIFQMAGALPFRNRTVNQLAANPPQDRPPVEDPNAPRTGTANFGTQSSTGTQPFRTATGTTPADGATSTGATSTADASTDGKTSTTNPNQTTTQPSTTSPALPAGW